MNTTDQLRELLMPVLGITSIDEIKPESALVRDLGAESIDFVEILYLIETEMGVKIKIQEIAMTEYSSDGNNLQDGKITNEIAEREISEILNIPPGRETGAIIPIGYKL